MQCLGGSPGHCTSQHRLAPALHMVSFENFVKSLPPSLSELKVKPIFCFPIKIHDNPTASNMYRLKHGLSIEIMNNKARHNLIDAKCRWRSNRLDGAGSFWELLGQTKVMQICQRETQIHQRAITHEFCCLSAQ